MRKSVFIASVMVTAVMGLGGIQPKHNGIIASAQGKTASTAEVKIDNFSFGPAAITIPGGNHRYLDQSRRHPAYRREHRKSIQIQGSRYRRKVLLHLHETRRVSLLLLNPSEDDRKSCRPVIARKRRMELAPI